MFVKFLWTILFLVIVAGVLKVFVYSYSQTKKQQDQTQGLDVKSGKEFDKQFKELEQFWDEREKAKKIQKPMEKQKPEANNSVKPKNMLLKRFNESIK